MDRTDYIEDQLSQKLPGYVRFADQSTPTPTPPPPPPTPTPPPPPAHPWPEPPKAGEIWVPRQLPDAPAYPTAPSYAAKPGDDLAKLPSDALLPPGIYVTSGDIKKNFVGALDSNGRPTLCVIRLKSGQSVRTQSWAGVTFSGGGTKGDDMEKNGSVFPSSGSVIHSGRVTGGAGLGILVVQGDGNQIWFTEVDNCACGSWGASKCKDLVVRGGYFHDVNSVGRRNTNKCVRCEGTIIADNIFDWGRGGHHWWDQYNCRTKRGYVLRNYFGSCVPDDKNQAWSVMALRTEINGPAGVDFRQNYVKTFYSCDESRNVVVDGNTFEGKDYRKVIELRNKARGTPDKMWLENITITSNIFLNNSAEIGASNDSPPTLSANKITVALSNVWPDGRVKEHVTVKP